MNESLDGRIKEVNASLKKGDYTTSLMILRELAKQYPDEGIIPYYLGRIAMSAHDEELAVNYFERAKKNGCNEAGLFLSMGILLSSAGKIAEAESHYLESVKLSETQEMKWATSSALAIFYLGQEMFLKAEKISKQMIADYPDNYQGYHIHVIAATLRKHYDEVISYMDKIPDSFKTHPQYLTDLVEICKMQKNKDELLKMFETDDRFEKYVPQIVLRERISALTGEEHSDIKEKMIYRLAEEYHDSDAVISTMILEFSKQNFRKSSEIANVVLENEKVNPGLRYYLALYFQIFNLYYLSEKRPSAELRKWIEDAGKWCVTFADGLNIPDVGNTVRESIQELFDEINRSASE